ncbi:unnamed protein product [Prunus armeniaca]
MTVPFVEGTVFIGITLNWVLLLRRRSFQPMIVPESGHHPRVGSIKQVVSLCFDRPIGGVLFCKNEDKLPEAVD